MVRRLRLVDHHHDRDLRRRRREEADEARRVLASVRILVRAVAEHLVRRSGLGRDVEPLDLHVLAGALIDHRPERLGHLSRGRRLDDLMRARRVGHVMTPLGIHHVQHELRWHVQAAIGNRVIRGPHLHRGRQDRLTDRDRGDVGPVPFLLDDPLLLEGQAKVRVGAEAEAVQVVDDRLTGPLLLDHLRHLDRAHVRGVGDDLLDGHHLGRVGVRVLDRLVVERDRARYDQRAGGRQQPLVERHRRRRELHDRAGLVLADRLVERSGDHLALLGPRGRCHRQDLTRSGTTQDDRAAAGLGRPDLFDQRLFRRELQRAVEGERHVCAGPRRAHDPFRTRYDRAADGALDALLPRLGGELRVEQALDPRAGLRAVAIHRTDHRAGQVAADRHALGVVLEHDARELRRSDLVDLRRVDLAGDDGVTRIGSLHGGEHLRPGQAQDRRQRGRGAVCVLHHGRVDRDQLRRHRHHEGLAVAVEDRAAQLGQTNDPLALRAAEVDELVAADDTDPHDAGDQRHRHHAHGGREDRDASPRWGFDASAAASGRGSRGRRATRGGRPAYRAPGRAGPVRPRAGSTRCRAGTRRCRPRPSRAGAAARRRGARLRGRCALARSPVGRRAGAARRCRRARRARRSPTGAGARSRAVRERPRPAARGRGHGASAGTVVGVVGPGPITTIDGGTSSGSAAGTMPSRSFASRRTSSGDCSWLSRRSSSSRRPCAAVMSARTESS